MFVLDSSSSVSLVQQIVDGFSHLVDEGTLRSGAKLPSIRQFAHAHGVSVYTVVDAYDRLVAQGYFVSRPHLGFFVRRRRQDDEQVPAGGDRYDFDSMYYMRRIFEHRGLSRKPGCGWLPEDWLFGEGGGRRRQLQWADLAGEPALVQALQTWRLAPPTRLWARHSRFELSAGHCTITELFLPDSPLYAGSVDEVSVCKR